MFDFMEGIWEGNNPVLIAGGIVLALFTSPKVRKATRRALVKSIAGVMAIANEASQLGTKAKNEWNSIIEESKHQVQVLRLRWAEIPSQLRAEKGRVRTRQGLSRWL